MSKRMCDCNQGRLPCSCNPGRVEKVRLRVNATDLVFLLMFAWLAVDKHPAWWLAVLATVAVWFLPPGFYERTIFIWRARKMGTYVIWSRCSTCGHQKKEVKQNGGPISLGGSPCEKCGNSGVDCAIGGPKPSWWVDEVKS